MFQPVTIENDALRAQVWPQYGGKVTSLIDKADGYDLLFSYPCELPTTPQYGRKYGEGWYAGWDECFPAVAAGPYPSHPYEGVAVPDHGELWTLPTTAVPTRDGITTVWHGLRFGYRFTRKLYLRDASVCCDYTLVNLAPLEFRFVWALHALMNTAAPPVFDLPPGPFAQRLPHHPPTGQSWTWPHIAPGGLDLSDYAALPDNEAWKVFSEQPVAGPARVRYPARGRSVSIDFQSDDGVIAYWGVWINCGQWAGHKHFAIEPTVGRHDALDPAVRDQSAGRLPPMGRLTWTARLTVSG